MKYQLLDASAIGAFGLSSVSGASSYFGWFNFVNTYAPGIGVLLSLFFGLVGAYFMFKSSKKEKKAEVNERKIEDIEDDILSIKTDMSSGFKSILDKLNKEE